MAVEPNERRMLQVVSQDRERIAGDLHDRVIQRLFAAGLQLQGLAARVPDEVHAVLREVIGELDASMIELRSAIFALTQPAAPVRTGEALQQLASRAQRLLGFRPVVRVRGSGDGLSRDLHDDLLAVAQEAVTNVVRHAEAGSVRIELEVGEDFVTLEVTDDGAGMPSERPRHSGTANLERRARERGGSATWASAGGGGTRLVWSVPLPGRV